MNNKKLVVRINDTLLHDVKEIAKSQNRSVSNLVIHLLKQAIEQKKNDS